MGTSVSVDFWYGVKIDFGDEFWDQENEDEVTIYDELRELCEERWKENIYFIQASAYDDYGEPLGLGISLSGFYWGEAYSFNESISKVSNLLTAEIEKKVDDFLDKYKIPGERRIWLTPTMG